MADHGAQGLLSPLLRARRIRAARPLLRGRVLDFGCGTGALAEWIEPATSSGAGQDAKPVEEARRPHPRHGLGAAAAGQGLFDTIAALAAIEHLPEPQAWLRQMRALLAPRGCLVLATPHPAFRLIHDAVARAGLFSRDAAELHNCFFDRAALKRLAASSGFQLVRYRRFLLGANQLAVLAPYAGSSAE